MDEKKTPKVPLVAVSVRLPRNIVERARLAKLRAGSGTSFRSVLTTALDAGLPDLRITDVKKGA